MTHMTKRTIKNYFFCYWNIFLVSYTLGCAQVHSVYCLCFMLKDHSLMQHVKHCCEGHLFHYVIKHISIHKIYGYPVVAKVRWAHAQVMWRTAWHLPPYAWINSRTDNPILAKFNIGEFYKKVVEPGKFSFRSYSFNDHFT
jgi:hypothetical protein